MEVKEPIYSLAGDESGGIRAIIKYNITYVSLRQPSPLFTKVKLPGTRTLNTY